jgi:ribonuclease T
MTEVYISVDVEAAGPLPPTYSMLSLGACVVGNERETFYMELRPINTNAVPEAMKVVGRPLTDFERDGRDPKEVMTAFMSWVISLSRGGKPVFVGFNAVFDWAFVNSYFHTYAGTNPFGFGGIDIKSYYMGMTGCSWDESRSSRIPQALKGKRQHTHNALDDAVEQGEMFLRMRQKADRNA